MIDFVSSWAQGIIVAVIIATMIEMIAPEGNSKKYIKVVIGIYVLFQIINPVLEKVTNKSFAISSIVDLEDYASKIENNQTIGQKLEMTNQSNIQDIYIEGVKADIKSKIEEKGYFVRDIQIEIEKDREGYPLKKIQLNLEKEKKVEEIKEDTTEEEQNSTRIMINEIMNIQIMVHKDKEEQREEVDTDKKLTTKEIKDLREYLSDIYEINAKYINIS